MQSYDIEQLMNALRQILVRLESLHYHNRETDNEDSTAGSNASHQASSYLLKPLLLTSHRLPNLLPSLMKTVSTWSSRLWTTPRRGENQSLLTIVVLATILKHGGATTLTCNALSDQRPIHVEQR